MTMGVGIGDMDLTAFSFFSFPKKRFPTGSPFA